MCVGEELARMLIFFFGAAVVQNFTISAPAEPPLDLEGDVGITLTPRPQNLVFTARRRPNIPTAGDVTTRP